jgi:hypothetical protein
MSTTAGGPPVSPANAEAIEAWDARSSSAS